MYEYLGELEDVWVNLCLEIELNRDECIMERFME